MMDTSIKTKPEEFVKFHKQLMSNAPESYVPWYFPVKRENKDPDGLFIAKKCPYPNEESKGNWKAKWALLTYEQALTRLKQGNNVGISGREYDPLIIIDIDEYDFKDSMPNTLTTKSRKRCGWHGYCWKKDDCLILPINIPTDFGEIRSAEQYVVAPGSYCETDNETIDTENIDEELKEVIKKDPLLGVYTVDKERMPCMISFDELPSFFKEHYRKVKEKEKEKAKLKATTVKPTGKHSALYDLTIRNIVSASKNRVAHPLHASDTGANFSVDGDLAHCWRHLVSLNPIQFLCVKAGYMSCQNAGTGHTNSGAGSSDVTGDDGAIFWAWYQAKKDKLIPEEDPVPSRALKYIAKKHGVYSQECDILPIDAYRKVLGIIEEEYQ